MNLVSKSVVKEVLDKHQIRPLKRLGQNFLISKKALNDFINACDLKKNDIVLEIGPGLGTITQAIAPKVKRVIAIEKDKKMCEIMKETLKDFQNIEIINQDVLEELSSLDEISSLFKRVKVVGNLPFYIAAPVIRKFLETDRVRPVQMVFMIQKEVAQRICAKPPNMNILAVSVQFYAKPKIASCLPKNSFWPQPKVDSAILRIAPLINADKKLINADLFFEIVRAGFAHPRKQLVNNLALIYQNYDGQAKKDKEKVRKWLLENGIKPKQRAETLKVQDWINLIKTIKMN